MSAAKATLPPPSTALRLLEARVLPEFGAFWLMRPWLCAVTPPGDGHPVLVLPGLLADDNSTYALRSFLNSHGYAAFSWELGRNFGMRANLERFSHTDGICAWRACLNEDGPQAENIEVYGSHCGLGHHPAVVYAIADRLAQPEGDWKKFDRSSGWRHVVFPDWRRA
jgi:hypothetical protein